MGEIFFTCTWENTDEKDEALNEILNLGKALVGCVEDAELICEPLNERAYQACVYGYMELLPPMSVEDKSKYKRLILDERWELKHRRSDDYIDLGVGERECFHIGLSQEGYSCDEDLWAEYEEYNEGEDFLIDKSGNIDLYGDSPILIVEKSYRAEYIEGILEERGTTIREICMWSSQEDPDELEPESAVDLLELLGDTNITDAVSLIEDTRKRRNCSICEAIVESAFRILEAWCKKQKGKESL